MICKSCGSENEAGALTCAKCGHELEGEIGSKVETPKVATYIVGNIIYLIISLPFLMFTISALKSIQPYYFEAPFSLDPRVPILIYFVGGFLLARRIAGRVKVAAKADDYKLARKMARRSASLFAVFFALNLILGPYLYVGVASEIVYQEKSYESAAMMALRRLGELQNGIYEEKGAFASRLEEVEGWPEQEDKNVEVKILSVDGKCWKGSGHHEKGKRTVIYDHCGGFDERGGDERFTKVLR